MKIGVAGGTGLVGKLFVSLAEAAGHDVVVLARSVGIDLVSGAGVVDSLTGCDAVVDVTNIVTIRKKAAVAFFRSATTNLLDEAHRAGVGHVISLSIVNCDEVGLGYYAGKRAQEDLIRASSVPWTILRATQFFEFPDRFLTGRSPIAAVPKMLTQPAAAADVAQALLDLTAEPPRLATIDLAGPEQLSMVDMAKRVAAARGLRRLVVPISVPGAAMASGELLPRGEHITTNQTFEQYLRT